MVTGLVEVQEGWRAGGRRAKRAVVALEVRGGVAGEEGVEGGATVVRRGTMGHCAGGWAAGCENRVGTWVRPKAGTGLPGACGKGAAGDGACGVTEASWAAVGWAGAGWTRPGRWTVMRAGPGPEPAAEATEEGDWAALVIGAGGEHGGRWGWWGRWGAAGRHWWEGDWTRGGRAWVPGQVVGR